MQNNVKTTISEFFRDYAEASLKGDADRISAAYSDVYIEATPGSVQAYTLGDAYWKALKDKFAFMSGPLGQSDAKAAVKTIHEFAPSHFVADVEWTLKFKPEGKGTITSTFLISYIVRMQEGKPAILLYVSHEDEQAAMRRDGLI